MTVFNSWGLWACLAAGSSCLPAIVAGTNSIVENREENTRMKTDFCIKTRTATSSSRHVGVVKPTYIVPYTEPQALLVSRISACLKCRPR